MIIFNFKKSISRISEKKILSYITLQIGAYAYNILKKHIIMSINVTEKELDLLSKYNFIWYILTKEYIFWAKIASPPLISSSILPLFFQCLRKWLKSQRWRETTYKGDAGRTIENPQKITFLNEPSRSVFVQVFANILVFIKKIGKILGKIE